jgi:hypothetical protein
MTRNGTALGLGLAFVLGCFAAPMTQQFVVRPAQAAPEGVHKWEQYCSVSPGYSVQEATQNANQDLRNRGLEGWEITSTTSANNPNGFVLVTCFRRPLP